LKDAELSVGASLRDRIDVKPNGSEEFYALLRAELLGYWLSDGDESDLDGCEG
jgi:hypothetical protein